MRQDAALSEARDPTIIDNRMFVNESAGASGRSKQMQLGAVSTCHYRGSKYSSSPLCHVIEFMVHSNDTEGNDLIRGSIDCICDTSVHDHPC